MTELRPDFGGVIRLSVVGKHKPTSGKETNASGYDVPKVIEMLP